MRMPASLKLALPLLVWLAFFSLDAQAQALDSAGLFDDVLNRYNAAASGWGNLGAAPQEAPGGPQVPPGFDALDPDADHA